MPRGRPLLCQHLAAAPRLPHRPDVAPPPCASLPPFWAEHPRLHPPTHPLHPPETEFAPHHGQWSPPRLAPRVPGHAPALSLPHLETIAGCVRDTDTRAQASGFRGGRPGSGDSAGRPLRRICPPLSPAREERQEAQGPKAKSPGRGCPLPHPQSEHPHGGPGPSKPHPAGLTLQGNATPRDLFSGPACPLGAPCIPEARTPRPCSCPRSGKSRGVGGGRGAHKGPLWSGPAPAAGHAHNGRGTAPRSPGVLAQGRGRLSCGLGQGLHAWPAKSAGPRPPAGLSWATFTFWR